jgi:hypothetical protein
MTDTTEKINIDNIEIRIYSGLRTNLLKHNKESKSRIDSTPLD